MKKLILLFLAHLLVTGIFAQQVRVTQKPMKLTQKQAANDVKVVHNKFTMYFRPADLAAAIAEVDKVIKRNHPGMIDSVKNGKLKVVIFNDDTSTYRRFSNLFQLGVGCYLISRAKVVITKENKPLTEILVAESPEFQQLDSPVKEVSFAFLNGRTLIFTGRMDTRLKPPK